MATDIINKGIQREIQKLDGKLEKKPCIYGENKGIKRKDEQHDGKLEKRPCISIENKRKNWEKEQLDGKLEKKPCIYGENKGIKRENGKLEKRPCISGDKEKSHFEKLMGNLANVQSPFCEEVTKYEKLGKIGQGTFGEVFKARDRSKGNFVALKKVLMGNEKEGFPITALREIRILQQLKHKNVVSLIEVCRSKPTNFNRFESTFYLVFDFCEHDLAGLLSNKNVIIELAEKKMMMKHLLEGLYFIHANKILHRDMKAANILITKSGVLKIADFGLARAFSYPKSADKPNRYTNRVVTLWYRPPELLLGQRNYGPSIDLWGAGCIMAEMWTRCPIMQGQAEQHQLTLISQLCGSITPETLPGCDKLELYGKMNLPKEQKRKVKERLKVYVEDKHALDLLDKLLMIDPAKRVDSDTALNHDFFWEDPLPCDLSKLLQPHSRSMFELFNGRRKENPRQPGAGPCPQPPPTANDGQFQDRVF